MGEFFKDDDVVARGRPPKEKEVQLIDDFDDLCAAYNILKSKIQETTTQGYEAVLPIRTELRGSRQTVEDIGQIGNLRRRIESSRISRMEIGTTTLKVLKNIEDMDWWSERFIEYLEKHMDGMDIICKSAFKMIVDLHKEINDSKIEIRTLQDKLIGQVQHMIKTPDKKEEDSKKMEFNKFKSMLDNKLGRYEEALKEGDKEKIKIAKLQVLDICKNDNEKKIIARRELEKIMANFKKD